jgi:hypothetical protein
MKTTLKVFTAIMGLGLVILVGLHLFLQFGLTKMMREVVLPRVKAETGIDARIGRLSLNVPAGVLYLNDIVVRNPEGFLLENLASIDRIQIEVDIRSLLKQEPLRINNIEVVNGLINIVRNEEGEINLNRLKASLPPRELPADTPERRPDLPTDPQPERLPSVAAESKPQLEILIEGLSCDLKLRYLDFRFGQYDIALDVGILGSGISTQQDPAVPWGNIAVIGSLGDNRTSFVTDLKINLAPLTDPASPSFDLTGRVMEIDPNIIKEAYSRLGIRSAPFGLEPVLYCREGWFERSTIALNLRDIQLEEKLSSRLGGMASISSLRFPIKVEGSIQQPTMDFQGALASAIGGNSRSILDAFLKGAITKEAGLGEPPASISDAAVELLGSHVDEIGESEATRKALMDLTDGVPSSTNESDPVSSDVLVDILGDHVDEIGESEELKDELKSLGKWLFGN